MNIFIFTASLCFRTSVPAEAAGTETLRSVHSVYVFKKIQRFPSLLYQIDIFGFLQLDLLTDKRFYNESSGRFFDSSFTFTTQSLENESFAAVGRVLLKINKYFKWRKKNWKIVLKAQRQSCLSSLVCVSKTKL